MADLSHRPGDLSSHPDASEMRARYDRVAHGRDAMVVDGLVLLVGLYCAISPWTVHFSAARPELLINNLVLGLAIALIGISITAAPSSMGGLGWTLVPIGVWMILSPWIVSRSPDAGMIWNNILIGAVTCLLGLAAAAATMKAARET
ncbi:MAG: SPW repeat protein [Actinomycetota bacterium]|nr:SPW repeat protein [Actinomycetota bacterium]